jgi:hypothetical protein
MTGRLALLLALLSASSLPAMAQSAPPPPHLSVLDGRAVLTRGQDREDASANTPLSLGDRLATEDGRAEVLMGDGSALHLDASTTVDLNGDAVVRLMHGRLIVRAQTTAANRLQIDTAAASVRPVTAAEIHIAVVEDSGVPTTRVAVVRGDVDVETEHGRVELGPGQQTYVREGEAPARPLPFNSARADAFVRWSEQLVDGRRASTSAQYLPTEVRVYGSTFDQYGSWSYAAPYGYVWYPRVAATWRPYHHGRWRYGVGFGWTFVGYDPWGWATHHYGRWGLSAGGSWYWIPSSGWGAAWVHWAVAPGYVSWCPLGWNNRPVLGWGYGYGPRPAHYGYGYGHWRAWSVVPLNTFRVGAPVHHQPFDARPFTGPRPPAFVLQPTPPATAIPRGSVVAPGYRIAGPSVAPRDGQSRRGPAVGSASLAPSPGSRRGSIPAASGAVASSPSASASTPATSVTTPGDRGASVSRSARPGTPPVIYHRGTPPPDRRSGGDAYERAGVAVPRGLPADAGRPDAPSESSRGRSVSPYGQSRSPYDARAGESRPAEPRPGSGARSGDHPDYAAPRGAAPRGGDAPDYRPRSEPRSEPRSYSPPRDSGGSRQAAPPPPSRGDGGSRATSRGGDGGQQGSRGQGAPSSRSGGGRGGSMGTAVPRSR